MSAPQKPWESGAGVAGFGEPGRQIMSNVNDPGMSNQGLYSSSPLPGSVSGIPNGTPVTVRRRAVAPPIPPPPGVGGFRQSQAYMPSTASSYGYGLGGYGAQSAYGQSAYGAMSPYATTSAYGGLGSYGVGSYGGYNASSYGGYGGTYGQRGYAGYGMNRYPNAVNPVNNLESRFIHMAEEGSRPAFESIESVVQTFGSVSFMLESTLQALYSSFRAVLGVAENLGRVRSLFGQVFSTFAVLRALQWMYRKMMYYLGLRRENPGREAIWQLAEGISGEAGSPNPDSRGSFWPVALFLGMVCSGPYLVYKLLASLQVTTTPTPAEDSTNYVGVASHDFTARDEEEVSVKARQTLIVAPKQYQQYGSEWLMVSVGGRTGRVPTSYVHILGTREAVNAANKARQAKAASEAKEVTATGGEPSPWLAQPSPLPHATGGGPSPSPPTSHATGGEPSRSPPTSQEATQHTQDKPPA